MRIRPMRADDVEAALGLSGTSSPDAWRDRTSHLLRSDAPGCWVADDVAEGDGAGEVVGCAVALRRDLLWVLASLSVREDQRDRGIGRALLDAALQHSRGCLRGMLAAMDHPAALRRYRLAGFRLHPTLSLTGVVDRSALPVVPGVRDGGAGDLDLVDSVDRQARGATHRGDHDLLLRQGALLVSDTFAGQGYAVVAPHGVLLLGATTGRVATRLLWDALARTPAGQEVRVRLLTPEQDWAVDVGLAARLSLRTDGVLCLRGMRPPRYYLPNPALL